MALPEHRPLQLSDLHRSSAPFDDLRDVIRTMFPNLDDHEVLSFDYSVRLMLNKAKDNSVILAPGDSPSRMIMYANLCFVNCHTDLRSGLSTYVFPWKGKMCCKRIRFINFPLSGISGYRWSKDDSWKVDLRNYLQRILVENGLENTPLSFFDFICGNTIKAVTEALTQIRPGFSWNQVLNVCELGPGQDILTWNAERADCRGTPSYKKYDQPIPSHNYFRCNLVLSWCYYLNQKYREFENYRRCQVEFDYHGEHGVERRRVVVLKYEAPHLIGIDVDKASFKTEEFHIQKIENLRVMMKYTKLETITKGHCGFAEVGYIWGRSYTVYYPQHASYVVSYRPVKKTTREEVHRYLGKTVQLSLLVGGEWVPRTGEFEQWTDSSDKDYICFGKKRGEYNSYSYSDFRNIQEV